MSFEDQREDAEEALDSLKRAKRSLNRAIVLTEENPEAQRLVRNAIGDLALHEGFFQNILDVMDDDDPDDEN
jgi:hypothetical protein